jgi:hypothetical protein
MSMNDSNPTPFLRRVTDGASQAAGRRSSRHGFQGVTRSTKTPGGKDAVVQDE